MRLVITTPALVLLDVEVVLWRKRKVTRNDVEPEPRVISFGFGRPS